MRTVILLISAAMMLTVSSVIAELQFRIAPVYGGGTGDWHNGVQSYAPGFPRVYMIYPIAKQADWYASWQEREQVYSAAGTLAGLSGAILSGPERVWDWSIAIRFVTSVGQADQIVRDNDVDLHRTSTAAARLRRTDLGVRFGMTVARIAGVDVGFSGGVKYQRFHFRLSDLWEATSFPDSGQIRFNVVDGPIADYNTRFIFPHVGLLVALGHQSFTVVQVHGDIGLAFLSDRYDDFIRQRVSQAEGISKGFLVGLTFSKCFGLPDGKFRPFVSLNFEQTWVRSYPSMETNWYGDDPGTVGNETGDFRPGDVRGLQASLGQVDVGFGISF